MWRSSRPLCSLRRQLGPRMLNTDGVVHEAVQDGGGDDGVAEDAAPFG